MSPVKYKEINLATATSQSVFASECELVAVWVTTVLSAHAVTITDGSTVLKTLPASSAVNLELRGFGVNAESLTVASNALSTGKIIVAYRSTL